MANSCVTSYKTEMENKLSITRAQLKYLDHGYSLMEAIGNGAFGQVYLGSKYGNQYAIKEIPANLEKEKLDKLKNEAKVLKALNHPNIVRSIDSFLEDANFYIVLEFCNAGDLNGFILNNKPDYLTKLYVTEQTIDALSYLYEREIIHRDIKPDNIMINYLQNRCTIKIGDFGLARSCPNLTIEEPYYEFNYSPRAPRYYRPPESFDRIVTVDDYGNSIPPRVIYGTVTITTDIFSSGCLVMAMFSETTVPWGDGKLLLAPFIAGDSSIEHIDIARATQQQKEDYIRENIEIPDQPVMQAELRRLISNMVKSDWRDRLNGNEVRDSMKTLLQSKAINGPMMNCPPSANPAMMNYSAAINVPMMNCPPSANTAMMSPAMSGSMMNCPPPVNTTMMSYSPAMSGPIMN
ncbi:cyclin-dependent kinase 7-like [Patella vulgata]|uniref:cyclin-dependent kinase 7-like n=1 Tax=Patella vulgata TaxID=6465 RepID=UPI00217FFCAF|nr:cyclin-dependent kinase 7-like [Patella vulgata]